MLEGLSLDIVFVTTGITPILHRVLQPLPSTLPFSLCIPTPHPNPTPTSWSQNKLGKTEMTEHQGQLKASSCLLTLWLKGRYTPSAHFDQSRVKCSITAYYYTLTTQAFVLFLRSQGHFHGILYLLLFSAITWLLFTFSLRSWLKILYKEPHHVLPSQLQMVCYHFFVQFTFLKWYIPNILFNNHRRNKHTIH